MSLPLRQITVLLCYCANHMCYVSFLPFLQYFFGLGAFPQTGDVFFEGCIFFRG